MREIKFRGWLKEERKMVNIHLMLLSEKWIGYQIFLQLEYKKIIVKMVANIDKIGYNERVIKCLLRSR